MLRHFSLHWSFALSVEIDVPWVGYPGRAVLGQHSTYQKTHGTCIGFTALFLASFQVQRQSEATTWYFDFVRIQFWASGRRNCGLSPTCLRLRFATVLKGQMSCEDVKNCAYFVCFCIALTLSESFPIWFQARMLRGVLRTFSDKTNDQISEFPHWSGLGDVKTSLCKWGGISQKSALAKEALFEFQLHIYQEQSSNHVQA